MSEEKFGLTTVRRKSFTITDRIENFPLQLRKGKYCSPKYYSELTSCSWRLWARHDNDKIDIILEREDFRTICQDLDIKVWIVDHIGFLPFSPIKKETTVKFSTDENAFLFLSISKNDLSFKNLKINKLRFLPGDTLTIKCEITTYDSTRSTFENKDEFEKRLSVNMINEFSYWVGTVFRLLFIISLAIGGILLIYYLCVKPIFLLIVFVFQAILQVIIPSMKAIVQVIDVLVRYVFILSVSALFLACALVILQFVIKTAKRPRHRNLSSLSESRRINEHKLIDLIDRQSNRCITYPRTD